jgi:carboxyl-terminal processing protease
VVKAKVAQPVKPGEKDAEGKPHKGPEGAVPPGKPGDEGASKAPGVPGAEAVETNEDDPQLQKAIELLKTWKIFKELRPV